MKNTNKTNRIARTLTAAMAAVMMMTTAASVMASAADTKTAVMNMAVSASVKSIDTDELTQMGIDTIFTGIEELVPGGKFLVPYIKFFANDLMGKEKELSLDDINQKIDEMFSKLDALEKNLSDSMVNITAIQNFESFNLRTFNSQIHEIIRQIQNYRRMNISEDEKLIRIASLINNSSAWSDANSVFVTFDSLTSALKKPSLVKTGSDIFGLVYDHFAKSSMFSGEAIDKAKPVLELIVTDYIAGYYALMQCLSAQLKVCNMSAEQKAKVRQIYVDRTSDTASLIIEKINDITGSAIGKKKGTKFDDSGIAGRFKAFSERDRMVFINKDKDSVRLYTNLNSMSTSILPFYNTSSHGRMHPIDMAVENFNKKIKSTMSLNGSQVKAIAEFIKGRGLTLREYLKKNGFNVDGLPKNANLITGEAYEDTTTAGAIAKCAIGTATWHAFFKAFNIDEKNPSEKELVFWNTGCHGFGIKEWNFREDKNVVTFKKA